jgi:hypothetical protein
MAKVFDSYNNPTSIVVKDKNGIEVNPGDFVEVKHCIGRYGRTDKVRGTFAKATVHGVYLTFDKSYTPFSKLGGDTHPAGAEVLFTISQRDGVYYSKHNDFEHGHEEYMELVKNSSTP